MLSKVVDKSNLKKSKL